MQARSKLYFCGGSTLSAELEFSGVEGGPVGNSEPAAEDDSMTTGNVVVRELNE